MMLVWYVLALDRSRGGGIMMQHQQHACTHDARRRHNHVAAHAQPYMYEGLTLIKIRSR